MKISLQSEINSITDLTVLKLEKNINLFLRQKRDKLF